MKEKKKKVKDVTEELKVTISPQVAEKDNKCERCHLKQDFVKAVLKATEDARLAQERYNSQVVKVNATIAKYTKKLEDLEKS